MSFKFYNVQCDLLTTILHDILICLYNITCTEFHILFIVI